MKDFEKELTTLLNRYSMENDSDTPDYILAKYLTGCLDVFNNIVAERRDWHKEGILLNEGVVRAGER